MYTCFLNDRVSFYLWPDTEISMTSHFKPVAYITRQNYKIRLQIAENSLTVTLLKFFCCYLVYYYFLIVNDFFYDCKKPGFNIYIQSLLKWIKLMYTEGPKTHLL